MAATPASPGTTRATWLYGCRLGQQAEAFGQPWVTSRPWATLPDRLLQAWQRPIAEPGPVAGKGS